MQGGQCGLRSHRESHRGPAKVCSTRQPWELMVQVHGSSKLVSWGSVRSLCLLAPEGCEQETQDQACNTNNLKFILPS